MYFMIDLERQVDVRRDDTTPESSRNGQALSDISWPCNKMRSKLDLVVEAREFRALGIIPGQM